jgi:hypothetical protein
MNKGGESLLIGGAACLGFAGLASMLWPQRDGGGLAAVGIFLVILGMVFRFPTLLADDTGATSTMRVAVLMVVSLFVVVTMKAGWAAHSIPELVLNNSWCWVLAAAFGGKAAQSFAENMSPGAGLPPISQPIAPNRVKAVPPQAPSAARVRDEVEGIEDAP